MINKILIVEDNQSQRLYIVEMAKKMNPDIQVLSTDSIGEAIEIANTNTIEAFFVDIQLVDGNGIDLCKYLRNMEKYMFAPMIFITGVVTKEMEAFHTIHCYDYILKPFSDVSLQKVLKRILIDYLNHKNQHYTKNKKMNCYLDLDFKGIKQRISINDILYIESKNRRIVIQTKFEEILYKHLSLSRFKKVLPQDIIQVHQSFLVNKNYIEKIDYSRRAIALEGINEMIPVGVSYKKDVGDQLNGLV